MSSSGEKHVFFVQYGTTQWKKTLKGNDWNSHYNALTDYAKQRAQLSDETPYFLTINGSKIDSGDSLKTHTISKGNGGSWNVTINKGQSSIVNDENDNQSESDKDMNQAKCVVFHKSQPHTWYLSTDDGKIEDNSESFQEFCEFLEDTFGIESIDIDNWPDNVELFFIQDWDDMDDESKQIENGADFGEIFDDFEPGSDEPTETTFYFVLQVDEESNKLFIIEWDGNTVSWKPATCEITNKEESWSSIQRMIEHQFSDIKLNSSKIVYDENNNNGIENSQDIKETELNESTIESFWDMLQKSAAVPAMYFTIQESLSPEMINSWNGKIVNFDFSGKHNAEEEMKFLLKQITFRNKYQSAISNEKNEEIQKPLQKIFARLLQSLKKEGFSEASMVFGEIKECEKELSPSMNWSNAYKHINEAMRRFRPFNIDEMLSLYGKTAEAAKQVQNEDIVLILGHTGAGKSTTIHFLSGSTMDVDNTTGHIYPSKVINSALKHVKTEYNVTESVTRYIAGVPISLSEAGIEMYGSKAKDRIVLCDTPGFDDSSGAEVDVANGLGIIKAVEKAKSAKVILVIGNADLDQRMNGFKKLCDTLSSILTNFMDNLHCVSVIFTKITGDNPVEKIKTTFKRALKEMKERKEDDDDVVVETCLHIIQLCDSNSIIVLNPLKDDRRKVLETLFRDKAGWIAHPKHEFGSFVTLSSQGRIIEQIDRVKDSIVKSPTNYDLVHSKLSQLTQLNNVLSIDGISDRINDCSFTVKKFWNARCQEAKKDLVNGIKDGSLEFLNKELVKYKTVLIDLFKYNSLYQEHLSNKKNIEENMDLNGNETEMQNGEIHCTSPQEMVLFLFEQFDALLAQCQFILQNDNNNDNNSNNSAYKPQMKQQMDDVKYEIDVNDTVVTNNNRNNGNWNKNNNSNKMGNDNYIGSMDSIQRAYMIIECFGDIQELTNKYTKKINELESQVQRMTKEAYGMIEQNNFDGCFDILKLLNQVCDIHNKIGDPCGLSVAMKNIASSLLDELKQYEQNLTSIFGNLTFSPQSNEEMKNASKCFTHLANARHCANNAKTQLLNLISVISSCNRIYLTTLQGISTYCEGLASHIDTIVNGDDEYTIVQTVRSVTLSDKSQSQALTEQKQVMKDLHGYVDYFTAITQMGHDIEVQVSRSYHQTLQHVIGFLQRIELKFQAIMEKLDINNKNVNYNDLMKCISILQESKWVYKYYNGNSNNNSNEHNNNNEILQNVETRLEDHIDKIHDALKANKIAIETPESLEIICVMMNHLTQMDNDRFKKLFPSLVDKSKQIETTTENRILDKLQGIGNIFGLNINATPQSRSKRNDRTEMKNDTFEDDDNEGDDYNIIDMEDNVDDLENDDINVNNNSNNTKGMKNQFEMKEELPRLDKKFAQNSIVFVDKCQCIGWSSNSNNNMEHIIDRMKRQLTNHLSDYGSLQHKKMQDWLKSLMHGARSSNNNNKNEEKDNGNDNENDNGYDAINDIAYQFSSNLQQLCQINENYKILMKIINDSIQKEDILLWWQQRLTQSYKELEDRLTQLKNAHSVTLPSEVTRARLLSKIDWFLNEVKFNSLYMEYEKNLHDDAGYSKILDCINSDSPDFAEIGKQLGRMQQMCQLSNTSNIAVLKALFKHSQTVVARKMEEIFCDGKATVIQLRNKMDNDVLLHNVRLSQKQQKDSKSYCLEYLTNEQQTRIKTLNGEIDTLLNDCKEKAEKLTQTQIKSKKFAKAEHTLTAIETMSLLLNLNVNITAFEDKIEQELETLKNFYVKKQLANEKFNPYTTAPPSNVYVQLEAVLSTRPCYQQAWTAIETDITKKFQSELETAKNGSFAEKKRILRVCRSVLNSLPKDLGNSLKDELDYTETEIKEQETADTQLINELKKSKDMKQLVTLYYEKSNEKDTRNAGIIRTMILDNVNEYSDNMQKKGLKEYDYKVVFESFTTLSEVLKSIVQRRSQMYGAHSNSHESSFAHWPGGDNHNHNHNMTTTTTSKGNHDDNKDDDNKDNSLNGNGRGHTKGEMDMLYEQVYGIYEQCCDKVKTYCSRMVHNELELTQQSEFINVFEMKATFLVNLARATFKDSDMFETLGLKECIQLFVNNINKFGKFINVRYKRAMGNNDLDSINRVLDVMQLYQIKSKPYLQTLNKLCANLPNLKVSLTIIENWDYDKIGQSLKQKVEDIAKDLLTKTFINDLTKKSQQSRNEYFSKVLRPKFETLQKFCNHKELQLKQKVMENVSKSYDECQEKMKTTIEKLCKDIENWIKGNMLGDPKKLDKINEYVCCFDAFVENVINTFDKHYKFPIETSIYGCKEKLKIIFETMVLDVQRKVITNEKKTSKFIQNVQMQDEKESKSKLERENENTGMLVDCLIEIWKAHKFLTFMSKELLDLINDLLNGYSSQDALQIGPLSVALEKKDTVWGSQLVAEHEIFRGQLIYRFNKNAHSQTIEHVLSGIKTNAAASLNSGIASYWRGGNATGYDQAALKDSYKRFNVYYDGIVTKHLKEPVNTDSLVHSLTTTMARQVTNKLQGHLSANEKNGACKLDGNYWKSAVKEDIIQIMANIFAIWTLDNSKYYFQASKELPETEKKMFLLRPKAAQIVALFRLLNIDDGSKLSSNFVEIETGGGKSVTLGVASCVLALIGFRVNCVCYSKYLSKRDYESFETLFKRLGIDKDIEYSTLHDLCEKLITKDVDIRDGSKKMLLRKNYNIRNNSENARKPSILLFDEVDVLFSKSFFGKSYNPCQGIQHKAISGLTDFIWKSRNRISMNLVQNSQEYRNLQNTFDSQTMKIFDKEVRAMVNDVRYYDNDRYIVRNDDIYYKRFDSYETNIVYGYRTMFAYYYENEKGNIKNIDSRKRISITCGNFSFVELVKEFNVILGVTGTLKDIVNNKIQKEAIENIFKIEKYTFMPTLYTRDNQKQDAHTNNFENFTITMAENQNDFHSKLKDEICKQLIGKNDNPRCVFVFFENIEQLNEFDGCPSFGFVKDNRILLTEELTNDEKKLAVTRACMSESILLATKTFGRGTDFQVKDEIVAYNGGPHVIQTFFSFDKSEETQIKGRTARQGGQGSYSKVMNKEKTMTRFNISREEITNCNNDSRALYKLLDDKRNAKFQESFQQLMRKAESPDINHQNSVNLKQALMKNDSTEALRLLACLN